MKYTAEEVRAIARRLHDDITVADGDALMDESAALAHFTDYFVRNYPGPDTIIHDPRWHAPKIFRAAQYALVRFATQQADR